MFSTASEIVVNEHFTFKNTFLDCELALQDFISSVIQVSLRPIEKLIPIGTSR